MAVRKARAAEEIPVEVSRRRMVAVAAQLASWYTTYLLVYQLGGDGLVGFALSIVLEWLLLELKRRIFAGENRGDAMGWAAIALDTLINAGGLWVYVQALDETEAWGMLSQALQLGQELQKLPSLAIALTIGFLLSYAPFRLWKA